MGTLYLLIFGKPKTALNLLFPISRQTIMPRISNTGEELESWHIAEVGM